jgi:alcohol dehydrogenase class IV
MLLPTVVRWNAPVAAERYADLARLSGLHSASDNTKASESLAQRLEQLATAGGLQNSLSAAGVKRDHLTSLAEEAARQWTGGFNPRAFDLAGALEVYQSAY